MAMPRLMLQYHSKVCDPDPSHTCNIQGFIHILVSKISCLGELASNLGYDAFNAVTTEDMALEVCILTILILAYRGGT